MSHTIWLWVCGLALLYSLFAVWFFSRLAFAATCAMDYARSHGDHNIALAARRLCVTYERWRVVHIAAAIFFAVSIFR